MQSTNTYSEKTRSENTNYDRLPTKKKGLLLVEKTSNSASHFKRNLIIAVCVFLILGGVTALILSFFSIIPASIGLGAWLSSANIAIFSSATAVMVGNVSGWFMPAGIVCIVALIYTKYSPSNRSSQKISNSVVDVSKKAPDDFETPASNSSTFIGVNKVSGRIDDAFESLNNKDYIGENGKEKNKQVTVTKYSLSNRGSQEMNNDDFETSTSNSRVVIDVNKVYGSIDDAFESLNNINYIDENEKEKNKQVTVFPFVFEENQSLKTFDKKNIFKNSHNSISAVDNMFNETKKKTVQLFEKTLTKEQVDNLNAFAEAVQKEDYPYSDLYLHIISKINNIEGNLKEHCAVLAELMRFVFCDYTDEKFSNLNRNEEEVDGIDLFAETKVWFELARFDNAHLWCPRWSHIQGGMESVKNPHGEEVGNSKHPLVKPYVVLAWLLSQEVKFAD